MDERKVVSWRGHPDFHPSTFIQEEMDARNWTRDRMAAALAATDADDPSMCRLKLDMYMAVAPDERLRLGYTGVQMSRAFGVSDDFLQKIENSWLEARGVQPDHRATKS